MSGAPGSGKTILAISLAAELGYALLTKDRIKATLHNALEPDRQWSRKAGGRYKARITHPVHVLTTVQLQAMAEEGQR